MIRSPCSRAGAAGGLGMALAMTCLVLAPAHAQQAPAARLEEYLQALVRRDDFSGTVLVARDGRPLLARGYGLANREHDISNGPKTKYRIGSITKPITALVLLLLVQQGKLQLDDPMSRHVEEVPEAWGKVTIRHLLAHTGGVPEHTNLPDFGRRMTAPTTPRDIVGLVRDRPLDFPAGEKFKYCNTGYILLGLVAEKVSGQSYADLVRRSVLEPLGMADSGYDQPGLILKGRAS